MKELTSYQEAALDFSKHISLTANAGSGKTFVLSKRFVQIALNESIPLNSIVAITFTDKAAGELNRKIAKEIEERISSEKNYKIIRRLEKLRGQLVFANISTIHSFCINILKEFSPEAGIDADFTPIDSDSADELIDIAIQEILKEGFSSGQGADRIKYLIRFFGSKKSFIDKVKSVIEKRKNLLSLYESVYSCPVDEIISFYNNQFENDFNLLFRDKLEKALKCLKKINDEVLLQNPKSDKAIELAAILRGHKTGKNIKPLYESFTNAAAKALTLKLQVASKGYLSKEREALSDEIDFVEHTAGDLSYFDSITDDESTAELSRFARHFASVIVDINDKYESKKKQKGYLDFEDILIKTKEILKLEGVKQSLEQKYRYIMVDEYQDTNEIQYQIIMPILDNLNSGNLCVVGDEKQSIYMFRDADLEVFNRTKDKISELKSRESLLTLPHSFRLAPGIALFINHLFGRLFAGPELIFNEVSHSDLFCARTDDIRGEVEFILRDKESLQSEADLVAAKIISMYNSGKTVTNFSDVLILCRKRNSFKELEESFSKYRIPFAVVGGKGFFQKQTTLDVFNYLSFLLNRDNDAALLGILRGPFYSMSDTELMAVSLCEGKTFFEKLHSYALVNKEKEFITLLLQNHINEINTHSFSSLIRKILKDTAYWGIVSEKPDAVQEIANLEKLISNARNYSLIGYKTLYDFVEHLKEAIEQKDDEGQADIIDNSDSVKIMTIHQAKGLEAKAVFLYSANERERDSSAKAKDSAVDKKYGIIAKVPPKGDYFEKYVTPPVTGLYNYITSKKSEAETKRLLYVALTRAADYLCVSAEHKEFKFSSGSLAGYLFNTLGIGDKTSEIKIDDELTYLARKEDKTVSEVRKELLTIPVMKEIPVEELIKRNEDSRISKLELLTGSINRLEKNEFISASKISVFAQCPFKYYLTYEIGFSKLFKRMKSFKENYEFNRKEDEEVSAYADLRGTLIHSILEKDLNSEKAEEYVSEMIARRTAVDSASAPRLEKMEKFIVEDIKKYYDSDSYKTLKSFSRFKNEFEVYAAEEDYFLYGIVDKILYDGEKIIIVDYKTDSIKKEEIAERATSYFNQLKFYAYTISKSLKKDFEFELWILFIKYPEEIVKKTCTPEDLKDYSTELKRIISCVRENEYEKNRVHCPQCHLSNENNICIKDDEKF